MTAQTIENRWKRKVGAVVTGNRAFGEVTVIVGGTCGGGAAIRKHNVNCLKCVGVALGCKEIKKGASFA